MEILKVVFVGDGGVGKSCLMITYSNGRFPSEYVPTVFDSNSVPVAFGGKHYELVLWDSAGQEDYDRLRPLSYPETDLFMICFSLNNRTSLDNVKQKWYPEVGHYCPDTPKFLVGCKSDLRHLTTPPVDSSQYVTYQEGDLVAKELEMEYFETSSLKNFGLKECFEKAVKVASMHHNNEKIGRLPRLRKIFSRKQKSKPTPPVLPPAGKAPAIEIETSTFSDNWKKMLDDTQHADVIFLLESKHRLKAHKIVLCCGTEYFCRVFSVGKTEQQIEQTDKIDEGHHYGLHHVYDETADDLRSTVLELTPDVKWQHFIHVLEFIYTGLPNLPPDVSENDLDILIALSRTFELPLLDTICQNIKRGDEFLNPSIGTYYNDLFGQKMKTLFFNKATFADVIFKVQGEHFYGHKCVLATRSEVMKAMFSGSFLEGRNSLSELDIVDTSIEVFFSLMEYFYTDHCPIDDVDSVGVLVIANCYGQTRLVTLCELYITKQVDRAVRKSIEKSDIDGIGLLLTSQIHNAVQLERWALFFISSNYEAFKNRKEFSLLEGANREHVEMNRWPPVSYLCEVEKYECEMTKTGEKCKVM